MDYWAKRGRGRGTFNVAEGALTSKSQVAVQSGLMTNTKGDGIVEDEEEDHGK